MTFSKLLKPTVLAAAVMSVFSVNAETIAITNANVYTAGEQGIIENASIIIEDGKIKAVNPATVEADKVIDAQGKIVTPGFIGSMNQLGLVEVSAVSRSKDFSEKKADITFDASAAFNPRSTAIAYTRKGGITSNVVVPRGGDDMFKGQAFVADLSGDFDSVYATGNAVIVDLGSKSRGSRATELTKLHNKLEDAKKALDKKAEKKSDKDKKSDKEPKRSEKVINKLLSGEMPLIAYVDRATDILALIKLKEKFGLDLVISGAGDAVLVAEQLADAKVPVIMGAVSNLPSSFDSLHASLDNAGKLANAGVDLVFTVRGDTHNLYQLRFDAGVAIAHGMPKEQALSAITANVAEVFNINAGVIAPGKRADLVLWSGDPFELSSKVEKMWIEGVQHTTESRHDALRDRYTTPSDMPRAYTK